MKKLVLALMLLCGCRRGSPGVSFAVGDVSVYEDKARGVTCYIAKGVYEFAISCVTTPTSKEN